MIHINLELMSGLGDKRLPDSDFTQILPTGSFRPDQTRDSKTQISLKSHRPVETAANSRLSAQIKMSPEGDIIVRTIYKFYFFLLAIPNKPIRPEPNNQKAAGTGTTVAAVRIA